MSEVTSLGWSRWRRAWWFQAVYYAQTWHGSVVSSVLLPLGYLGALGVGVGHLVSHHSGLIDGQTYLHFIAPSLLATTAFQLGEGESLWPVLASFKWTRSFHAAVTTPLTPRDVLVGKLAWVATRAFAIGVLYALIIAGVGAAHSWWALTLPLLSVVICLAFAAPLAAYAAKVDTDISFPLIYRFGFVPMFLFSATFYPVSAYPGWLRPLVQLVPLYHGVALVRAACFGGAAPAVLAHLIVLLVLIVVGVLWGDVTFRRRLID